MKCRTCQAAEESKWPSRVPKQRKATPSRSSSKNNKTNQVHSCFSLSETFLVWEFCLLLPLPASCSRFAGFQLAAAAGERFQAAGPSEPHKKIINRSLANQCKRCARRMRPKVETRPRLKKTIGRLSLSARPDDQSFSRSSAPSAPLASSQATFLLFLLLFLLPVRLLRPDFN